MADKCEECGGELAFINGEWYCRECGTVREDNISVIEHSDKNPLLGKKTIEKPSRYLYNSKTYLSGEEEKADFEIPRKIKEVLNYIVELDGLIKNELPSEYDKKIFDKLSELTVRDYKEGIRTTQDKKAVVWATLLELIYKELGILNDIIHLDVDNQEAKNKVIKFSFTIDKLEKYDKKTFDEAEKIRSKDLITESEVLLKEYDFAIPINLEEIDISFNHAYKKGFHKLFSKGTEESWPDDLAWSYENTIRSEGIPLARSYVFQKLINRINYGEKNPLPEKTTGLLCVCCYIACKKYNLNVKSQEEWADFFEISKSIFEKLFKEFKDLSGEDL